MLAVTGHGTHVAGTVMSAQFGVAKAATAVDVKVISGSGAGSTAGVIAGIDWAARDNDGEDVSTHSLPATN